MNFDLAGHVAVVTGAGQGIGAGIVRQLSEAGATVVAHRGRVDGDLLDDGAADRLVAQVMDEHGRLDSWINNAGVQPVGDLATMSDSEFDAVVAANLTTTFRATRACADVMAPGSAIVNIASIEALATPPGHSHYGASKAAVVAHTRAAAVELGKRGIRVNAVAPGLIDRPGLADDWPAGVDRWLRACPLGRLGTPEDVGDACLFLVSAGARWITGALLVVDGGVSAGAPW